MLLGGNKVSCTLQIAILLQIPPDCDSKLTQSTPPFFLINAQDTQHGWMMLCCSKQQFQMQSWRYIFNVQYHIQIINQS